MQKNLNISLLRTFAAVAELGQITLASERVHVTQSAASQQIQRLEKQLGVKLLERTSNKVELSQAGERLYASVRKILALNDQILADLDRDRKTFDLRFGVSHDIVERVLPPVLRNFKETHPNVAVILSSLPTSELMCMFDAGALDVMLATEPLGSSKGIPVMVDDLVWVGAKGARAIEFDPIPVALGGESDRFSQTAKQALNRSGLHWQQVSQSGDLGSVFAMLAADMVIAPLLSRLVPHPLCAISDPRLPKLPQFQINIVISPQASRPELIDFAQQVKRFFSDLLITPSEEPHKSYVDQPVRKVAHIEPPTP
jgi:DNA-binding transcriptional LysR family regulator